MLATGIYQKECMRSSVFGLAISCPFYKRKPACPLHEISKQASSDIYNWLDNLGDKELNSLVVVHQKCFSERR